eukprot:TRINITY_DN10041_c0_g1_i4.p3 TRINITY_DN10041_c0_g1~~TRINITY_DN10041_c0_g1_i4.p3  ORF type:complete len:119 (+),score=21.86 TRINITY_DN10041_c0_g1_i4:77-433(+)
MCIRDRQYTNFIMSEMERIKGMSLAIEKSYSLSLVEEECSYISGLLKKIFPFIALGTFYYHMVEPELVATWSEVFKVLSTCSEGISALALTKEESAVCKFVKELLYRTNFTIGGRRII